MTARFAGALRPARTAGKEVAVVSATALRISFASLLLLLCGSDAAPMGVQPQTEQAHVSAAERRLRQGRRRLEQAFYDLARESFEAAAEAFPVRAATGAARCLTATGRPGEALKRLKATEAGGADAEWNTALGAALADTGRYDEAIAAFRAALDIEPARIEPRSRCAALLAYLGRDAQAVKLLEPLEKLEEQDYPQDAASRVHLADALLKLIALKTPKDLAERTAHVLHKILQPAFETRDRQRWMARLAAADLLASKHNFTEARDDYEAVLKLNPRVADAHVGLAIIEAESRSNAPARAQLLKALGLNPRHAAALRTMAALRLATGNAADARGSIEQLLSLNPNDLEALALAAAVEMMSGRDKEAAKLLERAAKINPRSAVVEGTLGLWLLSQRRFDDAERRLEAAAAYAPYESRYRVELAYVWLSRGEERRAKAELKAARTADPYNARAVNLLNILYTLDAMARVETEHFIVRFEEARDGLIRHVVPQVMEGMYQEIVGTFGFEPTRKTLVEVFPSRADFSVRISGRPWVTTVGASTGPVIAVVSPRRNASGVYGWASCLRHEFVHTVTLEMSAANVPRWLTEGLAEFHSGEKRSWEQALLLAQRYQLGDVLSLSRIGAAFHDARRPWRVTQAYAQGRLMVEFLREKWGEGIINRLLTAFRAQRSQRVVFRETLCVTLPDFDAKFEAWYGDQLRAWGFPAARIPSRESLKARLKEDEEDAEALGLLAKIELLNRKIPEARRFAERALFQDDAQPDALLVIGLTSGPRMRPGQAPDPERLDVLFAEVRPLLELRPQDPQALWVVGDLAHRTQRNVLAADIFAKLARRAPVCGPAFRGLAEIYLEIGDSEAAYPHLVQWAERSANDATAATRLADFLEEQGMAAKAVPWIERALRIDLFNNELYKRHGRLLAATEQWEAALRPLQHCTAAFPDDDTIWADLADAYAHLGRTRKAAEAAAKAISLNADTRAQQILDSLQLDEP